MEQLGEWKQLNRLNNNLENNLNWFNKYLSKHAESEKKIIDLLFGEKEVKEKRRELQQSLSISIKDKNILLNLLEKLHSEERKLEKYWKRLEKEWLSDTVEKLQKEGVSKEPNPIERAYEIQESGKEYEDLVLEILKSGGFHVIHTPNIDDYFGTGDIYLLLGEKNNLSKILAIDVMVSKNENELEERRREKYCSIIGLYGLDTPSLENKIIEYIEKNLKNELKQEISEKTINSLFKYLEKHNYKNIIKERGINYFLENYLVKKDPQGKISELIKRKISDQIISLTGNYQASINPNSFLFAGIKNLVHKIPMGFTEKEIEELKKQNNKIKIFYIIEKLKKEIEDFKNFVMKLYYFLYKNKEEIPKIILSEHYTQKVENIYQVDIKEIEEELEKFKEVEKNLVNKIENSDKEIQKIKNFSEKIQKVKTFWDNIIQEIDKSQKLENIEIT